MDNVRHKDVIDKSVNDTVATKCRKHETVINRAIAYEKPFLRSDYNKLTKPVTELTSEICILRKKLNTLEETMKIKLDQIIESNKSEIKILNARFTTLFANLETKHATDLEKSERKILKRISTIENDLSSIKQHLFGKPHSNELETVNSVDVACIANLEEKYKKVLETSENNVLQLISVMGEDIRSTKQELSGIRTREEKRRISFTARLYPYPIINLPGGSKLILNQIRHNDGNGYDHTTGIFTCPESGVYLFVFFVKTVPQDDDHGVRSLQVLLRINGAIKVQAVSETHHKHQEAQGGNSVVSYVNKGEQVWLESNKGNGIQNVDFGFTTFTGTLLY